MQKCDLSVLNGRVMLPGGELVDANIGVRAEKIIEISSETIDAE